MRASTHARVNHDSYVLCITPQLNFEATGERVPFNLLRERNEERDEGKTLQQIADELGYNNASSVHFMLNK